MGLRDLRLSCRLVLIYCYLREWHLLSGILRKGRGNRESGTARLLLLTVLLRRLGRRRSLSS